MSMVLHREGRPLFALGMYERPRDEDEWRAWREAGVNLVRCGNREQLDKAHEHGMFGWVPVPMVLADDDDGAALAERIEELKDHPALAVWEAPDEIVWRTWGGAPGRRTYSADETAQIEQRVEALVRGLARGSALIRERDPRHALWLNEARMSDRRTLARCAPYLDIVSFDHYPIPEDVRRPRHSPMYTIGSYAERFHRAAPGKELWFVGQAFSWSTIRPHQSDVRAYPTREQYRFMAWQAIAHGATGLLWWGSSHEMRPAPFLNDLMTVLAELHALQPFLAGEPVEGIAARADDVLIPDILGVSCVARQAGGRMLLALVNEDPHEHDAVIEGLEIEPEDMRLFAGPAGRFVRIPEGFATPMMGYEVRVYVTD